MSDFFGKNPEYTPPQDAKRFSVDDFAAAFIRLEGGIILDFRISWAMHMDAFGDTLILGKRPVYAYLPPSAGTARWAAR